MSASSAYSQPTASKYMMVLIPVVSRVNTSTLAFVMFVALAFLNGTHGKGAESRTNDPRPSAKAEVVIDNFVFSPSSVAVPVGAIVTWINHDSVPHLIVSADNHFQKSQMLSPGQSFSHTFTSVGTYRYFCSIHPRMTGKIIVK